MYSLKDKVVLITGAANGIGAALVRLLIDQETKHVRILDIDEKAGSSLELELNQKYGNFKVKFSKCDITNEDELFEAYEDIMKIYGHLDVVVNNAGVVNESNTEFIRKEVEVNVTAVINGTLKAIELMRIDKGGKGGTVINISSIAALIKHSPFLFVYAATKSAILQFSNCIGREPYCSKTGVRVITICYGPTKTGFLDKISSFDDEISLKELLGLYPFQTPEIAALGTLQALKNGKSGSTWVVHNGRPAKDITTTVEKAYADIAKVLDDD